MAVELWIRSYGPNGFLHNHQFAQLVLPLQGTLDIELEGRGALLDQTRAAYVAPGVRHDQISGEPNRFLIVDIPAHLDELPLFPRISTGAARLIQRMARTGAALWTPLLVDALQEEPRHSWTVSQMAERVGLSPSRLHTIFRQELETTPHAWLAERRLEDVQRWLTDTDRSIADIALQAGFSDQSALTKALRKATGKTPATFRQKQ
ncbi:hypothetical protein ABS71_21125 [bacterium SCN 62-11]|nr:helix-turn-helix domain-containing protein [Candidatus Eremiobacteraeota bacterium]ODT56894.1 MAG: hypothetical protein ABS71_21125 [bacterium SCN 62-11]